MMALAETLSALSDMGAFILPFAYTEVRPSLFFRRLPTRRRVRPRSPRYSLLRCAAAPFRSVAHTDGLTQ